MAYVILADARMGMILEKAAAHLRRRGHDVDVVTSYQDILQRMEAKMPDVLVFTHLLRGGDGLSLRDEIHRRYPVLKTKLIWIAVLRNDDSSPAISWDFTDISAFLTFPVPEWQVVLSVEQLLYRTVEYKSDES